MHHRIKQWQSGEFCVVLSCRAVYSTPESPSPSALWHTTAQRSAPRHTASRNSRSTHNKEDHSLVLRPFIEQINSTHSLYTTSNLWCSELSITQANELVVVRTSLLAPHNQDDPSFVAFSDVVILNYNSTTFWCVGYGDCEIVWIGRAHMFISGFLLSVCLVFVLFRKSPHKNFLVWWESPCCNPSRW